jgi:hypothetical protein
MDRRRFVEEGHVCSWECFGPDLSISKAALLREWRDGPDLREISLI